MDFATDPQPVRCGDHGLRQNLWPAIPPRDAVEHSCQRAVLKTLLEELFHVALAFAPGPGGKTRRAVGCGRVSVPAESQLRFDGAGWARLSIHLGPTPELQRALFGSAGVEVPQLPGAVSLLARVARTHDRRLAVEWRLPEPCHPLLRPERTSGAVITQPSSYEFLALFISDSLAALAAADSVAEPAAGPAAPPHAQDAPRHRVRAIRGIPSSPPAERCLTISTLRVESRRRFDRRPPDRYVPLLRIAAGWLAACGFDSGQRVRVQVEPGRLVLTPSASADPARRAAPPSLLAELKDRGQRAEDADGQNSFDPAAPRQAVAGNPTRWTG
jgi:Toxin SymE, type I toxin-antitoxin system